LADVQLVHYDLQPSSALEMLVSEAPPSDVCAENAPEGKLQTANAAFYLPALDGIRGIAFLLVFVSHAGLGAVVPGGLGVTVFFFLSGYLITTLLRIEGQRNGTVSLRKFYIRRARRILPPMYVTLVLAYFLGHLGILDSRGTWQALLAAVFYYYNYFELLIHSPTLPTGLSVVWSLMIEEHFYLLFPFVYRLLISKKLNRQTQASILVAACVVASLWRFILIYGLHVSSSAPHPWTYSATDARFDSILWGCVLAIASNPWYKEDREASFLNKFKGTWALAGLFVVLGTLLFRSPNFRETARYTLQGIALYPIFFYCGAARGRLVPRILEFKPLMAIGHLSYAMYLIHDLALQTLQGHVMKGLFLSGCVAFLLTTAYALLMRTLVENPLRKLIS
jgi:peptidoglycan/LPS O-acetylase OafA/YrhL